MANGNNGSKRMGMGRWMYGRIMMPIRMGIFMLIMRGICLLILCFVLFFLVSGGINQVKTGQTLVNYTLMKGHMVADLMDGIFHGTNDTFVVTKDGIYLRSALQDVPENSALDGVMSSPDEVGEWSHKFGILDILNPNVHAPGYDGDDGFKSNKDAPKTNDSSTGGG